MAHIDLGVDETQFPGINGPMRFRPETAKPLNELTGLSAGGLVIDGYLIPEDISLTFMKGKQNAVDVLTGSNKDEANFGVCGGARGGGGPALTAEAFRTNVSLTKRRVRIR